MEKLDFYYVDNNYLEYLNKIDNSVAYNKKLHDIHCNSKYKFEKFYIGILLEVNGHKYIAPVSSNKNKYRTSYMIKDELGNIIGSVRFNFMIPVNDELIKKLKISDFDKSRGFLLHMEKENCNKNKITILNMAKRNYKQFLKGNYPSFIKYCDFKKLERACSLYQYFKEFNEYAKQKYNMVFENMKLNIIEDELEVIYNDSKITIDGEVGKEVLARHLILPFDSRDDYLEYNRNLDLNDEINSKSVEEEIEI